MVELVLPAGRGTEPSTQHAGQYGKLYAGQSTQCTADKARHTECKAQARHRAHSMLLGNMENLHTGQGTCKAMHTACSEIWLYAGQYGELYAGQSTQTRQCNSTQQTRSMVEWSQIKSMIITRAVYKIYKKKKREMFLYMEASLRYLLFPHSKTSQECSDLIFSMQFFPLL